ncbi:MAG: chondroitinase family polysaccharide lyase, partial [Propionibacteriaceae bacterium]|nr:chondroitinase family polysaccharide lyase [Propionibacteriaceae bacterium]
MTFRRINRRNFLLASAAVSGTCAIPLVGLSPAYADRLLPMDDAVPLADAPPVGSSLAEIEAAMMALEPPILLLETAVPAGVTTDAGSTLAISATHAKCGDHSMQWNHTSGAKLRMDGDLKYVPSDFVPGGDQSLMGVVPMFSFWVYNEKPVKDALVVEFGKGDRVDAHFRFNLDFRGWRTCWIRYSYDMVGTPKAGIDRITVTAPKRDGQLWIDLVAKNIDMRPDHATPDFQVPEVQKGIEQSDNYHWLGINNFWGEMTTPGFDNSPATAAEKTSAEKVRNGLIAIQRSKQGITGANLTTLETELTALGIPQLANPDATGADLVPAAPGSFVNSYQTDILPKEFVPALKAATNIQDNRRVFDTLLKVARTWDTANIANDVSASARAESMLLRLTAHVRDQGWAVGSAQGTIHHIGYQYRGWAQSLLLTESVLKARGLWEYASDTIAWYAGVGRLTNDFTDIRKHNSGLVDVLNTLLEGLLVSTVTPTDETLYVGRLRAFSSWINLAHRYTPGLLGGYKPDGLYFHHMGPYPAYGRDALNGSIRIITVVTGSEFELKTAGAAILRQAMFTMNEISDTYQWPIGMSARHPKGTEGIDALINNYALLGRNPLAGFDDGNGIDEEMASVYRSLVRESSSNFQKGQDTFFAGKGIEPASDPQGYFQYGYSAFGSSRHEQWMASVKGFNRYLWSSEIYDGANAYGRYLFYGQIEVQSILDARGLVTHEANGWSQPGYDWNHIPGATTIVLPYEELKADLTGTIQEIPLTESSGGAGKLTGHATLFGMHLAEHPMHNGTHKANISALLVGERVIALGSDIENDDRSHPTHTTLFQLTPETMTEPKALTKGSNWATDPAGNGYVVSQGAMTARTAPQTAPHQDGISEGATRNMALGWLDHGKEPKGAGYDYALLVGAGTEGTEAFAAAMAGDDKPYVVAQKDKVAHVVTDRDSGVMAHVLFEANTDLVDTSVVRMADRPCLILMHAEGSTVSISVTDPDLHLYEGKDPDQYDKDGNYTGEFSSYSRPWRITPSPKSNISVVLRGLWTAPTMARSLSGVMLTAEGNDTRLTLTTQYSASVEFTLVREEVEPSVEP